MKIFLLIAIPATLGLSVLVAWVAAIAKPPASPTPQASASPAAIAIASPSAPATEKPWKAYLPQEDQGLRSRLVADPFLEGWLRNQDTWVGYATTDYLLGQGFFVNAALNHDGQGQEPNITNPRGSCSTLSQVGQIPAMICGKSAMTWQWGIQAKDAQNKVAALMESEVYEARNPQQTSQQTQQASQQAEFNAEIFEPPTNCRADAGKEFAVVTVFPRGVVLVDADNPKQNEGTWYRETYKNCWVHESQLRWLKAR